MSKGEILFLHGYTQSSSVFYAKTSALRKKLTALGYKAVYLNGPISLTPAQLPSSDALSKFGSVDAGESEKTNFRSWWLKDHNDCYTLEEAIETVRVYMQDGTILPGSLEDLNILEKEKEKEKEGIKGNREKRDGKEDEGIVGIVGFSQGAGLAGALVDQFEEIFSTPLKFAILYSGFKVDTRKMPQYDYLYTKDNGKSTKTRLLHVIGELDTVVGDDRAYTFYDITKENSDLLKHPGGHFVPNSRLMIDQVTNWIQALDSPAEKTSPKESVQDLLAMMDSFGK